MRILLDTNVLIAAFITRGVCKELFEHCLRQHEIVASEFILREFQEHLVDKFKYTAEEASQAIDLLRAKIELVEPVSLDKPVSRDPDDDAVLGTAKAGEVTCIITGDKDLLVLKRFEAAVILSPGEFSVYEAKTNSE